MTNYGEDNPNAKLTWAIVDDIRQKYNSGKYTYSMLSQEFAVSPGTIAHIVKNRRWIKKEGVSINNEYIKE